MLPWDTPVSRGGAALPGMSSARGCFLRIAEPAVKYNTSSALGSQAAQQQFQSLHRHCFLGRQGGVDTPPGVDLPEVGLALSLSSSSAVSLAWSC